MLPEAVHFIYDCDQHCHRHGTDTVIVRALVVIIKTITHFAPTHPKTRYPDGPNCQRKNRDAKIAKCASTILATPR